MTEYDHGPQKTVMLQKIAVFISYTGLAKDYVFNFMVEGNLQIIRDWIKSDFALPKEEIANLIFSICNAVCSVK